MRCIDVASGPVALKLLSTDQRFDVVISDAHVPEMDGEQLATHIRAMPETAQLPLMLLSSLASRHQAHLFDASHTKPVRAHVLREILGRLLAGDGERVPAAAAIPNVSVVDTRAPIRVLVAEDNPVNQTVMKAMLARLGHSATIVADGQEALDRSLQTPFDVILMDVHMPTMDGLQATRAIRRQLPPERQPTIIALTASSLDEDRQNCASAGMNGYLLKPLRIQQLASTLAAFPAREAEAPCL